MIEKYSNEAASIKLIFSSLILITKIFRSLNSQVIIIIFLKIVFFYLYINHTIYVKDFAEEFENNMEIWMTHFLSLLTYDNQL